MTNSVDIHKPQKLSGFTIIISIVVTLKQIWPLYLFMLIQIFSNNKSEESIWKKMGMYLVGIVAVFLLRMGDILKYFTTTFFFNENNEFVLKTGLFTKKETIIPLYKIQSFQSSQSILNRFSNTFKVNIETAGSKETEAQLLAITGEQLIALRQVLEHNTALQPNEIKPLETVESNPSKEIKLSILDFLRLCISENHLKTLGLVTAFVFSKLQEVKDLFGNDYVEKAFDSAEKNATNYKGIAIFIALLIILTLLISCVRLALKFFGYSVKLDAKKMYIQWGLLSTQQKTIYYNKIQMLDWRSNGLRRLLKLSVLRVFATGESEGKQEGQINIPITKESQIETIQPFYQSNIIFDTTSFLKVDKSYTLRYTILIGLPIFLVLFFSMFFIEKWLVVFPIVWLCYFIAAKKVFQKRFKLWLNKDCIKIEQGVWGTENILLNWKNIQSIALRTSPYQRSNDLRDVIFYTAGKHVTVHYLPLHQAQFINDYAMYKLESKL